MIASILLVAARDFRQVVATRGFKVTLLIVPLAIGLSITASVFYAGPQYTVAYSVGDASGGAGARVERRLELDYQREVLRSLSAYAERWKLASADPAAPWAPARRLGVRRRGGAVHGRGRASPPPRPRLGRPWPRGAAPFKPPTRYFVQAPPPAVAAKAVDAEAFGRAVAGPLKGDVDTADGKKPFGLAIYIPGDFGSPGSVVRMWTNGRYGRRPDQFYPPGADGQPALKALEAAALTPEAAERIETLRAPVQVIDPPANAGRNAVTAKSHRAPGPGLSADDDRHHHRRDDAAGPDRGTLQQAAGVGPGLHPPRALMYGKLIGLGGVGLTIALCGAACAVGAAFFAPGFVADVLRPSLEALGNPLIVAAMIFYFLQRLSGGDHAVPGHRLAQRLHAGRPVLPDAGDHADHAAGGVHHPRRPSARRTPPSSMSCRGFPLYTPFAMLGRLGSGVPLWEMLGSGAVLAAFLALELLMLGRLFRASLLGAGQPSRAELFARLMTRGAG
ncbi:MAG: hypothetical protein WDN45_14575 [Caulobacteraceae bacterium]